MVLSPVIPLLFLPVSIFYVCTYTCLYSSNRHIIVMHIQYTRFCIRVCVCVAVHIFVPVHAACIHTRTSGTCVPSIIMYTRVRVCVHYTGIYVETVYVYTHLHIYRGIRYDCICKPVCTSRYQPRHTNPCKFSRITLCALLRSSKSLHRVSMEHPAYRFQGSFSEIAKTFARK